MVVKISLSRKWIGNISSNWWT